MSKLIAVWGSPNSGKTSFCVKLAREIYNKNSSSKVICVFPDNSSPVLPVLFPNKKAEDFYSMGKLLDMAEFTTNDVLGHFVLAKGVKNIVFMGYKFGENKFSYADYTGEKADTFLDMCKYLSDYVIVDCDSRLEDRLSNHAMQKADVVFRIASPTLKSVSFFMSNLQMYSDSKYKFDSHIPIMNVTEKDVYMPVEDAAACLGNIKHTIPYSTDYKKQFCNGDLLDMISDKKYQSVMQKIYNEVSESEQNK